VQTHGWIEMGCDDYSRAFVQDLHATPFYDRPDIIAGEITAIDQSTYQTTLERE
jgi:hypothetical protein